MTLLETLRAALVDKGWIPTASERPRDTPLEVHRGTLPCLGLYLDLWRIIDDPSDPHRQDSIEVVFYKRVNGSISPSSFFNAWVFKQSDISPVLDHIEQERKKS